MLKKQAKDFFLQKRKQYSLNEIEAKSKQICKLFFDEISLISIKNIHCFLPIVSQNEVNTYFVINYLLENHPNITISVPWCDERDNSMKSFVYQPNKLIKNKWNIEEPDPQTAVEINQSSIDMVLVPLVVFDIQGHRVGYGKGFYDRFLAKCKPDIVKIGLCFENPIDKIVDTHIHDVVLDICITPHAKYIFK